LSHNDLGPSASIPLANALAINSSLKELDVTWNRLGFDGIHRILSSLPFKLSRVISVQLHSNKAERSSLAMLRSSLRKKRSMESSASSQTGQLHSSDSLVGLPVRGDSVSSMPLPSKVISFSSSLSPVAEVGTGKHIDNILDGSTLYQLVGGEEAIARVVDTFYLLLVTDPVVGPRFFHHITMSRMRHLQKNYICKLLGGPQEYEGRGMFHGHRHLGINDDYFDQVLAHFGTAFMHHLPDSANHQW
jgi:hemoglobin